MVPKIRIKYKGKEYNLGFSSSSIQEMERRGFDVCKIPEKTLTLLPDLFTGSFIKNHPTVSQEVIDEIYARIDDKSELLTALADMYTIAIDEYIAELKKGNGLKWKKC